MSETFLLLGQKRQIVAANWIHMDFDLQENHLVVQVTDDGVGFNEKLFKANNYLFFTTDTSGEHIGMGLAVCDILSRKHGGSLVLSNLPDGGAKVTVEIAVTHSLHIKVCS